MRPDKRSFVWIVAIALAAGGAGAQDAAKPAPGEPTAAQRHQMAEIHQKMADCLASERPIGECRTQMQADCQQAMGAQGCPMLMGAGHGMMAGGMMGGGMMPNAPKPPDAK